MMPASLRLSWATRSTDSRGVLVLAAAIAAFTFGIVFSAASRGDGSFLGYWCSAVVTACLVGMDFPGTGHPRWSEFELSLPIAPLARARAQLLLTLATWLSPSLLAFALNQLGALGADRRLPPAVALVALGNATASVVFATAMRHSLALRRSPGAAALRLATTTIVLAAAAARSPAFGAVVLLLATPLLAIAHRAASQTPELLLASVDTTPVLAPIESPKREALEERDARPTFEADISPETTFGRMALRYSTVGGYTLMTLVMLMLWALGINTGWIQNAASHTMLLAVLVVSHAMWSTRLLRFSHLPYPRERLFRYVAWPPLAAIAIGLGLSLLVPPPEQLLRNHVRVHDGVTSATLHSPRDAWQLTTAEPPLVTTPDGESYRPAARQFGLGSLIVAYDPYEIPRDASHELRAYQLGRLLAEQRGLSLTREQLEERFGPGLDRNFGLSSTAHPDLRDPAALSARLVGAAALLITALLAMRVVIRPGAGLNPNWRRDRPYLVMTGLFLVTQLQQVASLSWYDGTDPIAIVLAHVGRPLADHTPFVVPLAAGLGVLLYRSLLRRFANMEAPLRAKTMDAWFIEI